MILSVIVPMLNESANAATLVREISAALDGIGVYEIICIDDGSQDQTSQILAQLMTEFPQLRVIRHAHRSGQSAALRTGIIAARAPLIATLDGDGQNDPADIPSLLRTYREQVKTSQNQPLMIAGHRQNRRDNWRKRLGSRFANRIRLWLLRDQTPDTGCGLKLFPREAFLEFPAFNHMHRYYCALMLRHGGRVLSIAVNHRPRLGGKSNYGNLQRLWVGISDLIGVFWLMRRTIKAPYHELGKQK